MSYNFTGSATSDSIHEVQYLQPVESNDDRESGPFLKIFPLGGGGGRGSLKRTFVAKIYWLSVFYMHILERSSRTPFSQLKSRSPDSVFTAHFQI